MAIPSLDAVVPLPWLPMPTLTRDMAKFLNKERLQLAEPAVRPARRYLQRLGWVVRPHGCTDAGRWACTVEYIEGLAEPPNGAVWVEDSELRAGIGVPHDRVVTPLLDASAAAILSVWRTQAYLRYPGGPMWQFTQVVEHLMGGDRLGLIDVEAIRPHLQGQQRRMRHPEILLRRLCKDGLLAPMYDEPEHEAKQFCFTLPPGCTCPLDGAVSA